MQCLKHLFDRHFPSPVCDPSIVSFQINVDRHDAPQAFKDPGHLSGILFGFYMGYMNRAVAYRQGTQETKGE